MKFIPLFVLTSGQVAVQVLDEMGSLVTHDAGIGTFNVAFHLMDVHALEKAGFEKEDIFKFPCVSPDYSYLPEVDDSKAAYLIRHLKEVRRPPHETKGH